jgi:hypothetical protein
MTASERRSRVRRCHTELRASASKAAWSWCSTLTRRNSRSEISSNAAPGYRPGAHNLMVNRFARSSNLLVRGGDQKATACFPSGPLTQAQALFRNISRPRTREIGGHGPLGR